MRYKLSAFCLILVVCVLPLSTAAGGKNQDEKRKSKGTIATIGKVKESNVTYETFDVVINRPVSLGLVLENKLTVEGFRNPSVSNKESSEHFFTANADILKRGDRIVKLNGVDVSDWNVHSFSRALKDTTVPYTLTIYPIDDSHRQLHSPLSQEQYLRLHDWDIRLATHLGSAVITSTTVLGRVAQFSGREASSCAYRVLIDAGFCCHSLIADVPHLSKLDKRDKKAKKKDLGEVTATDIKNRHKVQESNRKEKWNSKILVAERGGSCSFLDKAERAKEAGAAGLIVINSEGNIVDMTTDLKEKASLVKGFPVVMISKNSGVTLREANQEAIRRGAVLHARLSSGYECEKPTADSMKKQTDLNKERPEKESVLSRHKDRLLQRGSSADTTGKPAPTSIIRKTEKIVDKKPAEDTVVERDVGSTSSNAGIDEAAVQRHKLIHSLPHIYRHQFPDAHDIAASSFQPSGALSDQEADSVSKPTLTEKDWKEEENLERIVKEKLRREYITATQKSNEPSDLQEEPKWKMVVGPKGILRNFSTVQPVVSGGSGVNTVNEKIDSNIPAVDILEPILPSSQVNDRVVVDNVKNSGRKKISLERASRKGVPRPRKRGRGDEL